MPIARGHALDLHPMYRNARYTLQGLFEARDGAANAAERLTTQRGKVTIAFDLDAPNGAVLHAVAAREEVIREARIGLPHDHSAPWEAVRIAVELFRTAEKATRQRGSPLRWYKRLEVEKLRRVLQQHDWNGLRLDVGARLMSRVISHAPVPQREPPDQHWPRTTVPVEGGHRLASVFAARQGH